MYIAINYYLKYAAKLEEIFLRFIKEPAQLEDTACVTSQFMFAFYRNLLAGKSKLKSFKIAQKQIREQYKNPYYWAAFVMMD